MQPDFTLIARKGVDIYQISARCRAAPMAAWPCLTVLLCALSYVIAQAPGDGDPLCVDEVFNGEDNPFFDLHPTYAANERPLMDSRDYISLLQGNPTWQMVDNDNNNTGTVITSWTQQRLLTCRGEVTVCGFSRGGQENWLITQHIRRELAGGLRLRKVTVQIDLTLNGCDISNRCRQTFDVYKWQTSTINSTEARNTGNYENVGRVTPPITTGDTLNTEFQDIILDSENGFYLAIVDFSTCIGIERILVLYYVCPEETSQLISRPETIESKSLSVVDTFVNGECVENSSTERGGNPLLICGRMGQWQVVIPCLCDSGYELVLDQCSECPVGTYSADVSNGPCEACPANSVATQTGLTVCPCMQDYYRAPNEWANVSCTQSPSSPLRVQVSNVTNTSVVLSWLPPVRGGGRDFSEIYYTITATDTDGRGGVTVEVTDVTGTEANVTGLTPGAYYTFSVTAENAVSSQDTNINARTATATATTEEGVAGTVSKIGVSKCNMSRVVLSWSPPIPSNGVILYYNVEISRNDTGELVTKLNTTTLSVDITQYVSDYVSTLFLVKAQAVTSVGGGNFSSPMAISYSNMALSCDLCLVNSEPSRDNCQCVQDYYRTSTEVACTQPPSAPLNLTVSQVTNTSVVLSWLPPESGGGRDFSEIYYTITARGTNGGGVTVVLTELTDTEASLTGLTPGAYYTFSVTAENAVSSQDININARTATATATTEEGVAGKVTDVTVSEGGSVVTWTPPVPTNGIILYYNIRISRNDSREKTIILILEHKALEIEVTRYGENAVEYYIEIQAVTAIGAGDYSSPVAFTLPSSDDCQCSSSTTLIGLSAGVAVLIFLLLLLSTIIVVRISCTLRRSKATSRDNLSSDKEMATFNVIAAPLQTYPNEAYGKTTLGEMEERTDDVSYAVVR